MIENVSDFVIVMCCIKLLKINKSYELLNMRVSGVTFLFLYRIRLEKIWLPRRKD